MGTDRPIRGKIAAIVTERQVVINRGKIHGVTDGMNFAIYIDLGPIRDPDDPENVLDNMMFKKAALKVSQVYDKMSFCSLEGEVSYALSSASVLGTTLGTTITYPNVITPPMIKLEDWGIKVGDVVLEVVEPPPKKKPAAT